MGGRVLVIYEDFVKAKPKLGDDDCRWHLKSSNREKYLFFLSFFTQHLETAAIMKTEIVKLGRVCGE